MEKFNMNENAFEISENVNVNKLIDAFTDMANRKSLLARGGVSQQDLLMQIIGTIVHVAMEETQ